MPSRYQGWDRPLTRALARRLSDAKELLMAAGFADLVGRLAKLPP